MPNVLIVVVLKLPSGLFFVLVNPALASASRSTWLCVITGSRTSTASSRPIPAGRRSSGCATSSDEEGDAWAALLFRRPRSACEAHLDEPVRGHAGQRGVAVPVGLHEELDVVAGPRLREAPVRDELVRDPSVRCRPLPVPARRHARRRADEHGRVPDHEPARVRDADADADRLLAAEPELLSEDPFTYQFQIRDEAVWNDGTPVTADDFVFAFNRIARKDNASDLAYTLERVEGFVAVNQLGDANRLRGLRTRGDLELVIDLSDPGQPKRIGGSVPFTARGAAAISGENIFVAAGYQGLLALGLPVQLGDPVRSEPGIFRFSVTGPAGAPLQLQRSDDLRHWSDWRTVTIGATGLELFDTNAPSARQFYRAFGL